MRDGEGRWYIMSQWTMTHLPSCRVLTCDAYGINTKTGITEKLGQCPPPLQACVRPMPPAGLPTPMSIANADGDVIPAVGVALPPIRSLVANEIVAGVAAAAATHCSTLGPIVGPAPSTHVPGNGRY